MLLFADSMLCDVSCIGKGLEGGGGGGGGRVLWSSAEGMMKRRAEF